MYKVTQNVLILYIENVVIKIRKRDRKGSSNHGEKHMIEEAEVLDIADTSIHSRLYIPVFKIGKGGLY